IEAMTMGTKIVVMRGTDAGDEMAGRIQQIGAPLYLYNHPVNKFVAGFIGTPPMNFMNVKIVEKDGKVLADEGSFVLTPTAEQQKALKAHVGKEVSFGIRPEDLKYLQAPAAENNMQLKVTNKEPLGADTHVFLQSKEQSIVARVPPEYDFQLGDTVNFAPDMEKAKFFGKGGDEPNLCENIERKW
ncbi:MAG: TOBE domain-containing protein, partial [Treponemataceae bacterium]|nr:TOBE domain-containing protein [Treponemataceae bacterium]